MDTYLHLIRMALAKKPKGSEERRSAATALRLWRRGLRPGAHSPQVHDWYRRLPVHHATYDVLLWRKPWQGVAGPVVVYDKCRTRELAENLGAHMTANDRFGTLHSDTRPTPVERAWQRLNAPVAI